MAQYYFTVAALPQLFFNSDTFPTVDEFMDLCREHVIPRELSGLEEGLKADGIETMAEGNCVIDEMRVWLLWDLSLRSDLAVLRAQALGREVDLYQDFPRVLGTFEIAREAMMQSSPFDAEEIISKARWDILDELEIGHYFDIEKLLIYLLKLQILERRAKFTDERGSENFEITYKSIAADLDEALELRE